MPKLFAVLFVVAFSAFSGFVKTAKSQGLTPHASYLAEVNSHFVNDIADVDAVFEKIFGALPAVVQVLTTENYAYFTFYDGGIEYQGNMRLENTVGGPVLNFLYNPRPAPWLPNPLSHQKVYKNDGGRVLITSISLFQFEVSYRDTKRVFKHLDVSQILPAEGVLNSGEVFMGQVHDDSGLRFFMIYDADADTPFYLLDQSGEIADQFFIAVDAESNTHKNIRVGARTGFAFITEPNSARMRLIGVHATNVQRNNYFDGPFDQLPDSYKGSFSIKQLYEKRDPENAVKMDEHGVFLDGSGYRAVIDPYFTYESLTEFAPIEACLTNGNNEAAYRTCMAAAIGY